MRKLLLTTVLALPLGTGALWAQDSAQDPNAPSAMDSAAETIEKGFDDVGESASKEGEAILDSVDGETDGTMGDTDTATDDAVSGDAAMDEAAAPANPAVATEQSADELRVGWIKGAKVTSPSGESIGEIKDLILDPQGQVKSAVIGVGGFLGIGEKQVAVDWSSLIITDDGRTITSTLTKEDAEAAPSYEFRSPTEPEAEEGSVGGPDESSLDDAGTDMTEPGTDMGADTGTDMGEPVEPAPQTDMDNDAPAAN